MSKQAIQDYWDSRPCNSWWPEVGWDISSHKLMVEPHIWTWTDFPTWREKKVIDLGCGVGTMSLEFARNGAEVTAVDISEQSILVAKERANQTDYGGNIWWVHQDIEALNLLSWQRNADMVYSFGVLHHTPNPLAAIECAWHHLRPDGELWIMVYYRLGWKRLTQGRPEAQAGCPLVTYWTRRSVTKLLRRGGFAPYDMQVAHIFPYRGEVYGQGRLEFAFPWNLPCGKTLNRLLEPIFGQHLLVKARKV